MKSISKAMIAVMIAAAMCVVPLFVAEDSEAVTVTTGGKGASFEASSVSDDNFNKLANATYKEYLCNMGLDIIIESEGNGEFALTEVSVTDVSDVKLAKGTDIKEDSSKTVDAMEITFKGKFKATYSEGLFPTSAILYTQHDGTQDIYKELGTNEVSDGTVLTIEGTFTLEKTTITTSKFVKTNAEALAITETVAKTSQLAKFDGTVGFNNGVVNKTVTMTRESSSSVELKTTYDYYGVKDIKEVVAGTKAFALLEIESAGVKSSLDMKVGDVSGGYTAEYGKDVYDVIMALISSFSGSPTSSGYTAGTAAELDALISVDLVAPDYFFVTGDYVLEDYSLFYAPYVEDASLKTNDAMKDFLGTIGTTGVEFSDADSVSDSAYTTVNVGSSGKNNIVFYVIIGVLAVAVVALAVLMIKKK